MTKQLVSAAINVARDAHWVLNPVSGLYERSLLLEGSSTNLCLQSENFGLSWTLNGTPTRTPAAIASSVMGVALDLIGDDDAAVAEAYLQTITFTADGIKGVSIFMKKGATPPANGSQVRLRDTTAGADRLLATITWDGAGVPTVVMTTGTHLGTPIAYTNGVYRFRFATTTVTAANANQVQVWPGRLSTVADTGDVYAGGVQAENLPFATSYIKTTAATVLRGTDNLAVPAGNTPAPQEMTVYLKFIEHGTLLVKNFLRAFAFGNANPRFYAFGNGSGFYGVAHDIPTSVGSSSAAVVLFGDQVELRAVLYADGSVQIWISVNGAAEVAGVRSAANPLQGAWGAIAQLNLCSAGAGAAAGFMALLYTATGKPAALALRGTQSLATCRVS